MAVKIRMTRIGRRNYPQYRIAVFDTRTRRDGKSIEILGTYDPHQEKAEKKVTLNKERFDHWLSKGAKATEAVERILRHVKILEPAKK